MGPCRPETTSWSSTVTETSAAPPSFDDLFLDQHDRLYRALYFITRSSADAEELMQDAFLKLWERWDRIHTIDDPVAYLFRVAMNGFRMRAAPVEPVSRLAGSCSWRRHAILTTTSSYETTSAACCWDSRPDSAPRSCSRRSSDAARNRPPGSLASGRRPCACSPRRGEHAQGEMRRPGCPT